MQRLAVVGGVWIAVSCLWPVGGAEAAVIKGRVVDSARQPVAGAEIRIWRKTRTANGLNEPLEFGGAVIRTDAAGRFATPDSDDLGQAIRVVALADCMLAARSAWVLSGDAVVDVPDITPRRLRAVAGRVIDGQRRGVRAAMVFQVGDARQRLETMTDDDGRFRLEGVPEGVVPLFAEKPGFRFRGGLFDDGEAILSLARNEEGAAPLISRGPKMAEDARLALGRRLLDPYLAAVIERGSDADKYAAFDALAHIEPLDAIERLARCTFANKSLLSESRAESLLQWIEREPAEGWDEIRGLIETNEDPMWVASCYLQGVQAMRQEERPARLEWLNQCVLHARQVKEPAIRACLLARAALLLDVLGEREQAAKLVAVAREAVKPLVEDVFAAGALCFLAEAIAPTDLPAALAYIERIRADLWRVRAYTRVALRLAAGKPHEAEKVWQRAAGGKNADRAILDARNRDLPLFCFRLAGADLAAAERVAAGVADAAWRVRARGAIALALIDVDASAARRFLRNAVRDEGFSSGAFGASPLGRDAAASVMAWLLPVAERVDPPMTEEIFWRAVALRSPSPAIGDLEDEAVAGDIALAQMLARYDASAARRLLARVANRFNELSRSTEAGRQQARLLIGAAAAVDPRWAAELLEAMPDPLDLSFQHPKHEARALVLRVLGMNEPMRWKYVGYWRPEDEEAQ